MNYKKLLSPAILLLAAMIWGFAFAAQDAASDVGAFTLGFSRSIIAGIFLIGVVMALDKITKSERILFSRKGIDLNRDELIGGAICGTILAVASAFQQIGINVGTDGGKAAFITALYVVLVPIYALALKKKAPVNVWVSIGIAIVGFYLLCIKETLTIAPSDILVVIAAMIFPIHILRVRVEKVIAQAHAVGKKSCRINIIRKINQLLLECHTAVSRGVPSHAIYHRCISKARIFLGYESGGSTRVEGFWGEYILLAHIKSEAAAKLYLLFRFILLCNIVKYSGYAHFLNFIAFKELCKPASHFLNCKGV